MRRLLKFALFVALTLFVSLSLFSCNKDTTGPDLGMFTYPHPDGAEWVYKVTSDTASHTEKISLEGTSEHATYGTVQNISFYQFNDVTQEWQFTYTEYMQVTDGEVRVFTGLTNDKYQVFLQLPLEIGKEWVMDPDTVCTAKVVKTENITVPAGVFTNCYVVEYTLNFGGKEEAKWYTWHASGVGGYNGVYIGGSPTWELLEYNIPGK